MTVAKSQSEHFRKHTPQTGCPCVFRLPQKIACHLQSPRPTAQLLRINWEDECASGMLARGHLSECADSCL